MAAQEIEYYKSGNVVVTSSRAEFAGKTYAMANVTSVKMEKIEPSRGCAQWLFFLGIAGLVGGFVMVNDEGAFSILGGLVLVAAGYFWYTSLKPSYQVVLGSASGEVSAMESQDQGEIEGIIGAIKKAIIERG